MSNRFINKIKKWLKIGMTVTVVTDSGVKTIQVSDDQDITALVAQMCFERGKSIVANYDGNLLTIKESDDQAS